MFDISFEKLIWKSLSPHNVVTIPQKQSLPMRIFDIYYSVTWELLLDSASPRFSYHRIFGTLENVYISLV